MGSAGDTLGGVEQVEDVTAELLGGATPQELAAFRVAVLQTVLGLEVDERTALVLTFGGGAWREIVAERVPLQWGMAEGRIDLHPGEGR